MKSSRESHTSHTLLLRLRDINDQDAWDEFVERYAPRIYAWCRRFRLQEADTADVTQDVLLKLVKAMRNFKYDPSKGSFRGWLKTVTNHAVQDFATSCSKAGRGSGDTGVFKALGSIAAPEALAELAAEIEKEAEQEMLKEAEARVRIRVKPHTWEAYQLNAVEQLSAQEVAEKCDITVAEVYVAKSRVIKMLRAEVEKLDRITLD